MSQKKGFSRKVRLRLEMCSTCMKMCRDNCPTGIASASESFTPYIRSLNVILNEKGIRSYDEGALDSIFSCLTCNLCNTFCLPKVDEEDLMKLARASIVDSGIDVSKYSKIGESVAQHHNPLIEDHQNRTNSFNDLIKREKDTDTMLFLGCMSSYREIEIARSSIELLKKLNIKFAIMEDEWCCGSPAISTGFLKTASETMIHNVNEWKTRGITRIITPCSACYRTIKTYYPQHVPDFDFNVQHIIEVIKDNFNGMQLKELNSTITYHDPCHLGRGMGIYDEPREILSQISSLMEMDHSREEGFCCGAGGGVRVNFPDLSQDVGLLRVDEALQTGAEYLTSACPLCKYQLKKSANIGNLKVVDIVELINQLL
ncbi:MAG: (Fe-S)-binding protein [Candidatus Helarchaeota archaeon]|nr:(Fe-S)-binding protein [Candidatus Helarchaeota archaeon]